jgi:tetratricopeptide (TPR) repeat protein
MKVSQSKRSRWVYIGLAVMLLALLSFSMLPLVSSILKTNLSPVTSSANLAGISQQERSQLESEALGYQLVLEREPDNTNALRGLLETRLKQGDLQGAISPLERLAQLNSGQSDYTILLAQAKQQLGDFVGAAAAYQTILVSAPGDMRALKGMVDLLLVQNRQEEAIGLVQTTLKNTSQKDGVAAISLQLLLGEIYLNQKRYPEAIAVYESAIQANQEDFRPVLAKALVLREQGNSAEAQPLFDKAITLAPVDYKDQIKAIATEK